MSEWRDITLGDSVALERGHDVTEPECRIGHVPVMVSAGQNGFHNTALAKGPGISSGQNVASFGQVHFSKEDFWSHNAGLYASYFAVLVQTKVTWSFLHAALTQPEVAVHLGQMADDRAYPAERPEIIGAMQVAQPNKPKIFETFHHTCVPLFEQAEADHSQVRTLANLRDTLLPTLPSEEKSVAETDTELANKIT